ncbi:protein-S-isoprenylcysteine methyltransferase [candidate division LCP-89 bacterium B3_LCP]|uniref:Protein-S-isoprenylcysteine methyltransferase n=1 Tax=candidate division LCP-89 bacterium B3_LCP TaxID=2012998 RepID=A0A532V5M2_UNCL8|nr:MAG: protein-S-isoprenylcysteine methyltransferase [candidate division LCP-89 bacterium B3_LCP]
MDIRQFFFKLRSYTPIPLLIILLATAKPQFIPFIWGIALMLAGELIRFWGVAHAGGSTRTRDVGAHMLVTSGPFAHLRNPLYIGNALIYIGVACLAGGELIWILVAFAFCAVQYSLIVSLEEETLIEIFGIEYELYCRNVPRWMPRLSPWNWSIPKKPDWKDAWRNEKHTRANLLIALVVFSLIGIL